MSLFLGLILSFFNNILSSTPKDFEEATGSFFPTLTLGVGPNALLLLVFGVNLLDNVGVPDVEITGKPVLVRIVEVSLS